MSFNAGAMGQQPDKSFSQMSPEEQAQAGAAYMMAFMQSCPGKSAMAGVSGFGLGALFGLFMSSMAYDNPLATSPLGQQSINELPFKQQMKVQFSDMFRRSYSTAKNFGFIGFIFSGTECCIESLRAKNDLWNGGIAGCLTGGGLAVKSGPQGMVAGCAAFAAFSTAIDMYMRSDAKPPPTSDEDE